MTFFKRQESPQLGSNPPKRHGRRAVVGGALFSILVLMLTAARMSQELVPANTPPPMTEAEIALQSFLHPIPAEVMRLDPEFAKAEAQSTLMMDYPELWLAERRKDPDFVKAEQKAILCILKPQEMEAEFTKNAEFRK